MAKRTPIVKASTREKAVDIVDIEAPAPDVFPADTPSLSPRLSVPLDESGRISWGRIRSSTRETLRKALETSDLSANLGVELPAGAKGSSTVDAIPPEICGILFDSLSSLMVGLARRQGYTADAAGVLVFTEQEKAALTPATVAVANKYGLSFGRWQEEVTLGLVLTTLLTGKIAALRKAATVHPMPTLVPPAATPASTAASDIPPADPFVP